MSCVQTAPATPAQVPAIRLEVENGYQLLRSELKLMEMTTIWHPRVPLEVASLSRLKFQKRSITQILPVPLFSKCRDSFLLLPTLPSSQNPPSVLSCNPFYFLSVVICLISFPILVKLSLSFLVHLAMFVTFVNLFNEPTFSLVCYCFSFYLCSNLYYFLPSTGFGFSFSLSRSLSCVVWLLVWDLL